MRILECQGKAIFSRYGLPVPEGIPAATAEEAREAARKIGGQLVIKAQVPVGGRGKAGGIRFADGPGEAALQAEELLRLTIRGYRVRRVYVEEKITVTREYYIGLTLDRLAGLPVFMVSGEGGIDIEEVARKSPAKIARIKADPLWGLHPYQLRNAARESGVDSEDLESVVDLGLKLYKLFVEKDATLAEINPAVKTPEGKLVCVDSKLMIDDNAFFKHDSFESPGDASAGNAVEMEAAAKGIRLVKLDGDIAVIGNGAGLVMSTLDSIDLEGGAPADFLDVGGGAEAARVEAALDIVCSLPGVRTILINIFGGITRCDEVAKGIAAVVERQHPAVPIVARLAGTNEGAGKAVLENVAGVSVLDDMESATIRAVHLAKEGR